MPHVVDSTPGPIETANPCPFPFCDLNRIDLNPFAGSAASAITADTLIECSVNREANPNIAVRLHWCRHGADYLNCFARVSTQRSHQTHRGLRRTLCGQVRLVRQVRRTSQLKKLGTRHS